MPQSLSRVIIHITFCTKYRVKLIDDEIKEDLFKYLSGICANLKCTPIVSGGHQDHAHVLCVLNKQMTISKLLEELKGSSSKWIKTKGLKYKSFFWQRGYAAFSVNHRDVDYVRRYIENQEQRHSKESYKDELLFLLKKHNIPYDERYLWD